MTDHATGHTDHAGHTDHTDHADHEQTLAERFGQEAWNARYSESERLWSGNPNPRLVEQVAGLTPGNALDVGAGEGADAVWLARNGWQVTALDISTVALDRAAVHAREAGVEITTAVHDLTTRAPLPVTASSFDLVSAQFWHPPVEQLEDFREVIGAVVRPGGTLLIVGHHPKDLHGVEDTHGHGAYLFTPEKVADLFDENNWRIELCDSPTRPTNRPVGPPVLTDSVVRVTRLQ